MVAAVTIMADCRLWQPMRGCAETATWLLQDALEACAGACNCCGVEGHTSRSAGVPDGALIIFKAPAVLRGMPLRQSS